jgi:hypothetical protein
MLARLLLLVEIFSLRVLHFSAQDFLFESRRVCVALLELVPKAAQWAAVPAPVVEVEYPREAGQGEGVLR